MAASYLAERLQKEFDSILDDSERSKAVVQFYLDSVCKFEAVDPTKVVLEVTDGPGDGGLDGYMVDPDSQVVTLFQCKWYSGIGKLSTKDAMDLHRFYTVHLLPAERRGLSDSVKAFVGRYQAHYSGWQTRLVYLATHEMDPVAVAEYHKLKVPFRLLDLAGISADYAETLSESEEISNEMVFSVVGDSGLPFVAEFPAESPGGKLKLRVLQCAIRGIDLKRAYDAYEADIFSRNLRLGLKTKINNEIAETAKSARRTAFYVLHNGISVVCDKFELLALDSKKLELPSFMPEEERPYVENAVNKEGIISFLHLKDFQIVNGAQTTITLAALAEEPLKDVILPCKVTETPDQRIASDIAVCNNTQNRITPWDLVANSPELTFLQNYASRLAPPVFFQRRRGESWSQVRFAAGSKPKPERSLTGQKAYQAYLSFNGYPGPAYSRPGTAVAPNSPAYEEISKLGDVDAILIAGLIEKYEDSVAPAKGESDFVKIWTQWAIAALGHVYQHRLSKEDQWNLKRSLLAANAHEKWKRIRKSFIDMFRLFLAAFPTPLDVRKVFINHEETWRTAQFASVKPKDIWPYVNPAVKENSFESMRMKQKTRAITLDYYDINFAITAIFEDKYLDEHPLPTVW